MKFLNVLVAALSCVALCFGLVFILTIVGAIGYMLSLQQFHPPKQWDKKNALHQRIT